jgi:hypothetical protein
MSLFLSLILVATWICLMGTALAEEMLGPSEWPETMWSPTLPGSFEVTHYLAACGFKMLKSGERHFAYLCQAFIPVDSYGAHLAIDARSDATLKGSKFAQCTEELAANVQLGITLG